MYKSMAAKAPCPGVVDDRDRCPGGGAAADPRRRDILLFRVAGRNARLSPGIGNWRRTRSTAGRCARPPLEIIARDDAGKPDVAIAQANQLVEIRACRSPDRDDPFAYRSGGSRLCQTEENLLSGVAAADGCADLGKRQPLHLPAPRQHVSPRLLFWPGRPPNFPRAAGRRSHRFRSDSPRWRISRAS